MEITISPPHPQWRRKLSASPHPPEELLTYIKHPRKGVLPFLYISMETTGLWHTRFLTTIVASSFPIYTVSFFRNVNKFKITAQWLLSEWTVRCKNQNPHFQSCDIHQLASAFSQGIQTQQPMSRRDSSEPNSSSTATLTHWGLHVPALLHPVRSQHLRV